MQRRFNDVVGIYVLSNFYVKLIVIRSRDVFRTVSDGFYFTVTRSRAFDKMSVLGVRDIYSSVITVFRSVSAALAMRGLAHLHTR